MVHADLLKDEKERNVFLEEEFGLPAEEIPERVVVSPLPFHQIFLGDFEKRLRRAGAEIERIELGDHIFEQNRV